MKPRATNLGVEKHFEPWNTEKFLSEKLKRISLCTAMPCAEAKQYGNLLT